MHILEAKYKRYNASVDGNYAWYMTIAREYNEGLNAKLL